MTWKSMGKQRIASQIIGIQCHADRREASHRKAAYYRTLRMSLHKGQLYSNGDVSIGKSDVDAIGRAIHGSDVAQAARHWLHIAESEAI